MGEQNRTTPAGAARFSRHRADAAGMMRAIALLSGVLASFALPGHATAADSTTPDVNDPQIIAAGRDLFREKHCSHCHGADGAGGVNLNKRDLSNPTDVFAAIADGSERGSLRMPAWRDVLSDREMWEATAYVMSLARRSNGR
jgi:mono/diheme cytochrome c family protein